MAPWVFGAAGLAYALTPALVQRDVGSHAVGFAALLTVVTLAVGATVQQFIQPIARWTNGRQSLVGVLLCVLGIGLCAVEAHVRSLPLAVLVAIVLGLGYGVCLVAGLVEIRSMAGADALGGITGIYYALTYTGFALPALLAALAGIASYAELLTVLAAICLTCGLVVGTSTHDEYGF
jgi:hypothetical protein